MKANSWHYAVSGDFLRVDFFAAVRVAELFAAEVLAFVFTGAISEASIRFADFHNRSKS